MPAKVILGTQWGDEGKGKITDLMADEAEMVVRFQGGNNAGHTIVIGDRTFKLHLVPSGILRKDVVSVVGNGVVLDPAAFLEELDRLSEANVEQGQLKISDRAHVIMPYHRLIDGLEEAAKGKLAAGTTKRGIGPCYSDKTSRFGIRICDLMDPDAFRQKLEAAYPLKAKYIQALGGDIGQSMEKILEEYMALGKRLAPYVCDASVLINDALDHGKNILFEGAQGTHLDIDHGIYPHGTSSSTVTGGVLIGTGVGPKRIDKVVGVVKAYTSRVGTGPFPTELFDDLGNHIADKGGEIGTTTGRRRRVGWLDLVMVGFSVRVNGLDSLVITKADVLDGLDEIKVATHYTLDGQDVHDFPASMTQLARCQPQYHTLPGWPELSKEEWKVIAEKGRDGLPEELAAFVTFIEANLKVPVDVVSYGPGREENIYL
ncbi:MAG: adenylosuccinate synthase [Thermoplasmata archaeon]|nr:adenylosuccinate synthase [Thermoplasmata archaeon]